MKIMNLMEDTEGQNGCLFEHGLSFYIETANHKILLDTGATDAFLKNAERKGIDLQLVDTVVISHGHYDHTGGLLAFANLNPDAAIYIHKNALGGFYNLKNGKTKYIGMNPDIAKLTQVKFVEEHFEERKFLIDEELSIFTGVKGRRLWPKGNEVLKRKVVDKNTGERFVQDEFDHEQYLVISERERTVLLSGCAHNGILNILDTYREIYGGEPTEVISGFHTMKQEYTPEDDAIYEQTATELSKMSTVFYSGHCTGEYPMQIMKRIMGEQLVVLHSGDEIEY